MPLTKEIATIKYAQELVDLVDASGVIQKRAVPRTKIDLYPKLYLQIVIGVIFNSKDEILVHKRAVTKRVDPGCIDHICGGLISGETPEKGVEREGIEETGVGIKNVRVVYEGINKYNRYRYLLIGESDDLPGKPDPREVEWIRYIGIEELRQKQESGEHEFVGEFFEDTDIALEAKKEKKRNG